MRVPPDLIELVPLRFGLTCCLRRFSREGLRGGGLLGCACLGARNPVAVLGFGCEGAPSAMLSGVDLGDWLLSVLEVLGGWWVAESHRRERVSGSDGAESMAYRLMAEAGWASGVVPSAGLAVLLASFSQRDRPNPVLAVSSSPGPPTRPSGGMRRYARICSRAGPRPMSRRRLVIRSRR